MCDVVPLGGKPIAKERVLARRQLSYAVAQRRRAKSSAPPTMASPAAPATRGSPFAPVSASVGSAGAGAGAGGVPPARIAVPLSTDAPLALALSKLMLKSRVPATLSVFGAKVTEYAVVAMRLTPG